MSKNKEDKMYIKRILEKDIKEGSRFFPVVGILGPRQSGKTTLAKKMFPNHFYVSLEAPDIRTAAKKDPRTFLELHRNKHGIIIDEFQYVPELLSYIQTIVDEEKKNAYFILTGSQNFLMNQAISQSLAGRISIHTLLPLSINELKTEKLLYKKFEHALFKGFYPATFSNKTPHKRLYSQYVKTYIERDVRELTHVGDLKTFQTFLGLCAERVGQLVNFSELGRECRISDQTVKRWLSILEASYIIFQLQPYEKTFGKRLVKSPKIYFYDSGLLCYLLKLKEDELFTHSKKGNLFESFVIAEIIKNFYNRGEDPNVYFWRDRSDHEVDCIMTYGSKKIAVEIKASQTPNTRFFSGLSFWNNLPQNTKNKSYVVYTGEEKRISGYKNLVSWQNIENIMKFLD